MTDELTGPTWMKVLGGFLVASFAGIAAVAASLAGETGAGVALLTLLLGLLPLAVGILLLTASVRVSVGDRIDVRFFPLWRRVIPLTDVDTARIEDAAWLHFGGVGLRWKPGATGLILGNRAAAVIVTRGGHEYVVQCRDPEAVVRAIEEHTRAS